MKIEKNTKKEEKKEGKEKWTEWPSLANSNGPSSPFPKR
jgi:hypothetical protein